MMDISLNSIKVGMADLNFGKHPCSLITLGLGSCIGITLYDKSTKICGMAHIMLPSSKQVQDASNIAKFADTGILKLLNDMLRLGASRQHIVAKIAGGAQMFNFGSTSDIMNIGARNAEASKKMLKELNIPLIAEETGGNFGRTIEINSEDGKLKIKAIGHGIKFI
jgi:chemotaxis protein CheD